MFLTPESIRLVSGKADRPFAPQGRGFKPRPRLTQAPTITQTCSQLRVASLNPGPKSYYPEALYHLRWMATPLSPLPDEDTIVLTCKVAVEGEYSFAD
jgi:hypothetical protein